MSTKLQWLNNALFAFFAHRDKAVFVLETDLGMLCRHLAVKKKGLSSPLAATMTSMGSLETPSRIWSCSTLRDGVNDVVEKAQQLEVEEAELMKKIQDRGSSYPWGTIQYTFYI